jgi:transcriptional regulator with XRE-family HTH domain
MNDARTLLAKNMKKYRRILGISQMLLAARIGCSVTLIGNIEIKKRFPSAENLNRIANALGITLSDLFAETTDVAAKLQSKEKVRAQLHSDIMAAIDTAMENKGYFT